MPWVMTEGEEGYMISEVKGHMSEPWGIILNQQKAIKLIEYLEWGEALDKGQISVSPPKKLTPKKRRNP